MAEKRWSNQLEDYIVDELCTCGHLKSEHERLLVGERGSKKPIVGLGDSLDHDGNCGTCPCAQFTWERFVGEKESEKENPVPLPTPKHKK